MEPQSSRPKPAAARRARERERHEAEILAATERVVARRGYVRAGMAEIAREADFSVGTLYNFFDSKESLIERVVLDQITAVEKEVRGAIQGARGACAQLEAIAIVQARSAARRRAFLAAFASATPGQYASPGPESEVVLAALARLRRIVRGVIEKGVKEGELVRDLPVDVLALVFEAATRAHNLERVVKKEGEANEAEVRVLVRSLLRGLGRRTHPRA